MENVAVNDIVRFIEGPLSGVNMIVIAVRANRVRVLYTDPRYPILGYRIQDINKSQLTLADVGNGEPEAPPILANLTLSNTAPTQGVPWTANIVGATAGSFITAVANTGTILNIDRAGSKISGTFLNAGTVTLTFQEMRTGATNSPRVSTVTLTVGAINEVATLTPLFLSNLTAQEDTLWAANITGYTTGSTIAAISNDGTTLTVNNGSNPRTVTGTFASSGNKTITLTETRTNATNSPRVTTRTVEVTTEFVAATLSVLTLSASNVTENVPSGTVVGNIQGKTSGSTLTLTNDAGQRFAINDSNQIVTGLTAINYESATTHNIAIRETLTGATNTPRDTTLTITVLNANEAPIVANEIPDQTATQNSPFTYTIPSYIFSDVDAGTTLQLSASLVGGGALPNWLTFIPGTGDLLGTPPSAGSVAVRITATDGTLTVQDDFTITIAVASGLAAPTSLVWDTPGTDNTPNLTLTLAGDALGTDEPEIQVSTDPTFMNTAAIVDDYTVAANNLPTSITFTLPALAGGTWYARARNVRDGSPSAWVNATSLVINVLIAPAKHILTPVPVKEWLNPLRPEFDLTMPDYEAAYADTIDVLWAHDDDVNFAAPIFTADDLPTTESSPVPTIRIRAAADFESGLYRVKTIADRNGMLGPYSDPLTGIGIVSGVSPTFDSTAWDFSSTFMTFDRMG